MNDANRYEFSLIKLRDWIGNHLVSILIIPFLIGIPGCSNRLENDKTNGTLLVMGTFVKCGGNPILTPTVDFEAKRVYNPSVIINNGVFNMLYRAEGESTGTGVICLATSKDGINFERYQNNPVMTGEAEFELGGVEDPRVVKIGNLFYMTYTGAGDQTPGNICLAASKDLINWSKKGELLQPKPDSWNSRQLKGGTIVQKKINNQFVMYFQGEKEPWKTRIAIAFSSDLESWNEPIDTPVMVPRKGYFDSMGTEPGAVVLIDEGILLIYNGWDESRIHKTGWVLFSKDDPTRIVSRCKAPILQSTEDWEGHILFTESIVRFNEKWFLHYGVMDNYIGVAIHAGKLFNY
jgi:predicted GH43/DUF377 family glycosyl hydrolase